MSKTVPNRVFFTLFLISGEITAIEAWSSSTNGDHQLPLNAWRTIGFHSGYESNPWLRIKLSRKETITNVTIGNRIDCCGERLVNLEVRAGTKNDNTNEIVGTFKGPGVSGAKHVVLFNKPVLADFLTFQLMGREKTWLQIHGIYLNYMPEKGKYFKVFLSRLRPVNIL